MKEEDWTKGMEAVYRCWNTRRQRSKSRTFEQNTCPMSRLYDVDGDGVASKAEVEHITKVMRGFIISLTYVCTRQKISMLKQSGHNTGFDRADSCWSPLRRHDGEGGG